MKKIITILICFVSIVSQGQTADEILTKVDKNMSANNRIIESSMTIYGKRQNRTLTSLSYSVGTSKSFTEYLSPAREQGTKMLKLKDKLWIYSPSSDRTIQISGHLLRQSVMGSDLSYEDMMDDRKLQDVYSAEITGKEQIADRQTFVLKLTAKVNNLAYFSRKIWIDAERFVPLKEELYGKSGQILKRITLSEVQKINNRWFPMKIIYKDMLKAGKGTEMTITKIKFNQQIPEYIFTKAALKK